MTERGHRRVGSSGRLRRRLLWCGLWGVGLQAEAASLNAHLTYAGPAEQGQGQVQIEITDTLLAQQLGAQPALSRFRVVVGNGDARVMGARRVAGAGQPFYTVLAFDRSGSFASHWDEAFALADAFVAAMPTDGSVVVSVMSFHSQQTWHGQPSADPAQIRATLSQLKESGTLGRSSETSLMSAVRAGAKHAAERQAVGGGRQVILFTDAGEEGQVFTLEDTVRYVRSLGTPIHPIVLKQVAAAGSTSAQRFSTANDRMKKLAEDSGGQHIHVLDSTAARARMAAHASAAQRSWWLDIQYCDVNATSARFADQIHVDVLSGVQIQAQTNLSTFQQHAAGAALKPCASLPAPPSLDPSTATTDPAVATDPASSGSSTPPPDSGGAGGRGWLWPLILGALLLAVMLGVLVLLALFGGRENREAHPPAPKPSPPPPSPRSDEGVLVEQRASREAPGPGVLSPDWESPLAAPLPETLLVIRESPDKQGERLRIHKKKFTIGGDMGYSPDLFLDVPSVSGRHATIELYPSGALYITDHSSNGTFLDGQLVGREKRVSVRPGQVLGIGLRVQIEILQPGLQPAVAPPSPPSPQVAAPAPAPAPVPVSAPEGVDTAAAAARRDRQKTVYQPLGAPVAPDGPPPRTDEGRGTAAPRSRSRTIIQPLRPDDKS